MGVSGKIDNSFTDNEKQIIECVIKKYAKETPFELELITTTTTDFVAHSILPVDDVNEDSIVSKVLEIKDNNLKKLQYESVIKN